MTRLRPFLPAGPGQSAIQAALLALAVFPSCRPAPERARPEPEPEVRRIEFPGAEDLGVWRVSPSLSPDGRSLAYARGGVLCIRDADSTAERSFSPPDREDWHPAHVSWHPDGTRLLSLERHRSRGWRLVLTEAGTGERRIVSVERNGTKPPAMSPDGRHIALVRSTETWDERDELRLIALEGGAERVLVRPGRGDVLSSIAWSPRGDRIAFLLSHSGEDDASATLETAALDGTRTVLAREEDGRILTGPAGTERSTAWLRDGRLLFVAHLDSGPDLPETELRFVEVDPRTGAPLRTGILLRGRGHVLEGLSASADSTLLVIARGTRVEDRTLEVPPGDALPAASPAAGGKGRGSRPFVTAIASGAWKEDAEPVVFCAGSRCVQARIVGAEMAFRAFDPGSGPGSLLFRRPAARVAFAGLSPDGNAFAMGSGVSDTIEIVDADTGATRSRVVVPGRGIVQGAAWSSDGTALYASGVLTRPRYWIRRIPVTDPGGARLVWTSETAWAGIPVPSPDGTKISFRTRERRSELWRLEVSSPRR